VKIHHKIDKIYPSYIC